MENKILEDKNIKAEEGRQNVSKNKKVTNLTFFLKKKVFIKN